ncbi:hypothetical protein O7631_27410 [Micromonospora sp. WMMD967]|uniref:hypothetical protein n=1 Tax=Micromonospora sp. WMMD967 TaxID=3016101 RepID=UPI0024160F42|nr:hypothetical protein [Micromonospora sp. WMMD967]MDG4840272.1 hypothetical protein [Micromonospora sp. WMMD967]
MAGSWTAHDHGRAQRTVRADLTVADFRLLIAAHHGVVLAAGPDAAADSSATCH